jgi:glycopeptide antibiotics resistance protein
VIGGGILIIATPVVAVLAVTLARRRKEGYGAVAIYLALGGWALASLGVTLFPLPYQRELIDAERASQFLSNNLIPFATIGPAIQAGLGGPQIRVLIANVVMFVPFGFLVSAHPSRPSVRAVLALALIASCTIEFSQWLVSAALGYTYRTADVDDVLLNTIGGALGRVAFRVAGSFLTGALGPEGEDRPPIDSHG